MLKQRNAGDTLYQLFTLADYPASEGWSLQFRLMDQAGVAPVITFTCAASGDDHLASVAAATTANWAPGTYTVAAFAVNGSQRFTVAALCGSVVIGANLGTATVGVDGRSEARIALEAIRAKLKGKATDGMLRYRINDRELQSYSVIELMRLERFWSNQVALEDRAAGLENPRGQARRIRVAIR